MFTKLFSLKKKNRLTRALSYEEAREILEKKDVTARRELAAHPDARPEMLYYLATDQSPEIRRCVAANLRTPSKADKVLAVDESDEVRSELARKIGKLVPNLTQKDQAKLREEAIKVLEMLACDQLPRVRQIVAEEIKAARNVPKDLVLKLAHDVELIVSAPILEYSPLLNTDDLREIIATTKVTGALAAIAKRKNLEAEVSDDIAATLDIPAVAALLTNPSAQIREETLDAIIEHAENIHGWHAPIALRPNLSIRAIRRISTFVASALIDRIVENNDLPRGIVEELRERTRNRITHEEFGADEDDGDVLRQAKKLFKRGDITDDYMVSLMEKDRDALVMELLALKADIPSAIVRHIVDIQHPQGVTALAWKAGLSMRTAMVLQSDLAHVAPSQRLNARNGVDYPLSENEMKWQLGYFLDQPPA